MHVIEHFDLLETDCLSLGLQIPLKGEDHLQKMIKRIGGDPLLQWEFEYFGFFTFREFEYLGFFKFRLKERVTSKK